MSENTRFVITNIGECTLWSNVMSPPRAGLIIHTLGRRNDVEGNLFSFSISRLVRLKSRPATNDGNFSLGLSMSHPWTKTLSSNGLVGFALGGQIDDGLEC